MDTLKIYIVNNLFILVFICFVPKITNAANDEERKYINDLTDFANSLILTINSNIYDAIEYQDQLNNWAENSLGNQSNIPKFKVEINDFDNSYQKLIERVVESDRNITFDYKLQLKKLYEISLVLNIWLKNIERNPFENKFSFYNNQSKNFKQLENISKQLVDICYDFSLACSVNFKKENLPKSLDILKISVAQSKNIIMALRNNHESQMRDFLQKANQILIELNKTKAKDISIDLEFKNVNIEIEFEKIKSQNLEILSWGEQFLQSNFSEEEVHEMLQNTVKVFSGINNDGGLAKLYNVLSKQSPQLLLKYTEEPISFKFIETKVEESVEKMNSNSSNEQILSNELKTPNLPQKIETTNILSDALPSNIVVLMDVSASIKRTGKLPILKTALNYYIDLMRPEDKISLIAFSGHATILIQGATIQQKNELKVILENLGSAGGTDILNGLQFAFKTAENNFLPKGNNKIILATDGEFGVKPGTFELIEMKSNEKEIFISVFHFATQKEAKSNNLVKNLTTHPNSFYALIENENDCKKAIIKLVKP